MAKKKHKRFHRRHLTIGLASVAIAAGLVGVSASSNNCNFTTIGTTMKLQADCTTDETITIPDGFTLDGFNHTITAVDPSGDHFKGAVVKNAGSVAHVTRLAVKASALANVCDAGADRLRGIMFEGAAGSIVGNTISDINQGPSGCQEGNAIEVRNAPFDGTHPDTKSVEIANNTLSSYQKTGIVANGDVSVDIHNNKVGASATQANLAANAVQLGFGGQGIVTNNLIDGNSWCCADAAATAVLLFQAGDGVEVRQNVLGGNADVGIYVLVNQAVIDNNKVFEEGPDGFYDIGVGDYDIFTASGADDNVVTNNKVRGYETSYDEVSGGKNKVIPGPQHFN
ncbi:MAG: right-handed parallel beta-helix repeat-containing protein [Candidatus Levybacteria bacterium]|nr:right-handed parallel beta-helix repeat-containing protein [Candidatus Levybacteria bacterium]